jgi:hypothetical protein
MRIPLMSGIIIPMDLSGSLIHRAQRKRAVDQMEEMPRTARKAARTAKCCRENLATLGTEPERAMESESEPIAGSKGICNRVRSHGFDRGGLIRGLLRGPTTSLETGARGGKERSCGTYNCEDRSWILRRVHTAILGVEREGNGEKYSKSDEQES